MTLPLEACELNDSNRAYRFAAATASVRAMFPQCFVGAQILPHALRLRQIWRLGVG